MAVNKINTSRSEAIDRGHTTYFTGRPCPHGHNVERYASNGSCVACAKKQSAERQHYYRDRYRENKKAILERQKKRYESTRESCIASAGAWAKANPEMVREIKRAYKLRRRGMEANGATAKEVADWAKGQTKVCHWCEAGCKSDYHVDHYFPLSKGGKHETENLVISCPTCNMRKSAKDPYQFAQERGRLF